jgi:hypothetical protein
MRQLAALYLQEDSWYHFCYRLSQPQDHSGTEGLGQFKKPVTSSGTEPATFQPVA